MALTAEGGGPKGLSLELSFSGAIWPGMEGIAAVGAVAGHCFTPWLAFKGGKGFATAAGVCGALSWPLFVIAALVWAAVIAVTRTSSLASLSAVSFVAVASFVAPLLGFESLIGLFLPFLAIQVIVVIKHEANIKRLFSGQEPKIGSAK